MKIKDIYYKYELPYNLQIHQLRVASLTKYISDMWDEFPESKTSTVEAALLHDMGNILKYNFERTDFFGEEDAGNVSKLIEIKERFRKIYGESEVEATMKICREINVNESVISIIETKEKQVNRQMLLNTNWDVRLCMYSDFRISPNGLTSIFERFEDFLSRNINNPIFHKYFPDRGSSLLKGVGEIEEEIHKNTKHNPTQITENDLEKNFDELLNYDINLKS